MKRIFLALAIIACAFAAKADEFGTRMYMLGSATPTGWSIDDMKLMETLEVGHYVWVGDLVAGEIRFKVNNTSNDWGNCYGPATTGAPLATGELGWYDNNFAVAAAGRYKIDINLLGATPAITVEDATGVTPTDVVALYPHYLYPIGSALSYGWSLDDARTAPLKETAFDSGIYTGTMTIAGDGELKFLKKGDWGPQYGPAENGAAITNYGEFAITEPTGDNKYAVSGISGEVSVTIDVQAGTLVIGEPSSVNSLKAETAQKAVKTLENGEIVIIKNGVKYNIAGAQK